MPDEAEFSAKFIAVFKAVFYRYTHFKVLSVLTPKSCVKRITKTENVKQLPKSAMFLGNLLYHYESYRCYPILNGVVPKGTENSILSVFFVL